MTDDLPDDDEPALPLASPEPDAGIVAEVVLVVPAAACQALATVDVPAPPESPLLEAVGALGRKVDGLQALFDRELRAEATREKVVDRLHAELQEYKQDLVLSVLRPVFIDLVLLYDDIGKMIGAPSEDEDSKRLRHLLEGFQQGILDILYRQGVEPYQTDGDAFDPKRQRAITTVATDDPALNKTVAARLRPGFQLVAGAKMVRPEQVSVHALRKA